jgi:hypothetical protein
MRNSLKRGAWLMGAVTLVFAAAHAAHAGTHPAVMGKAVVPGNSNCFVYETSGSSPGLRNVCSGTNQWDTALVVDTTDPVGLGPTGKVGVGGTLNCTLVAHDSSGTQVLSIPFGTWPFPAGQYGTIPAVNMFPPGSYAVMRCALSGSGTRLLGNVIDG